MCGRFTLRASPEAIAEQFALFDVPELRARYNIAPSQEVLAVRTRPGQTEARRELAILRWGLVPSWADDPAIGNRLINARAETAAEKPAFRAALARRRCLIVADGFYEWQGKGRAKQPYWIGMRHGGLFGLGGLWESWDAADGSHLDSCTILTTEANLLVRPLHDRMPLIVAPEDYHRWLDPGTQRPSDLAALLKPFPSEAMEAIRVSTHVNSPANEDARCIEPLSSQDELSS